MWSSVYLRNDEMGGVCQKVSRNLPGENIFPQQQNFAMGSSAQISSGAIRCSFNTRFRTRFRRVPVQIPREVPEGSEAPDGSVRFRRVPVQIPREVPEGSGEDTC